MIVRSGAQPRDHTALVADEGRVPEVAHVSRMRCVELDTVMRGGRRVLEPCTLTLPAGSLVGLVGRNGSGKSSLLMALAGMLRRGRVLSWGTGTGTGTGVAPGSTALVMQHPPFPEWVRVRTIAAAHGTSAAQIALAMPGLLDPSLVALRVNELSGGQRQRLAVAIALARRDPLLLLDEPFASIDVPGRLALREALHARRQAQPELTVVLSAHAPADLHGRCDSIIILSGSCVRQLSAEELAVDGELHVFERRLAEVLRQ